MARYSVVRLNIDGNKLVGLDDLRDKERNALSTQNAIYIYRGTKSQKVYVGQTVHFRERHKQHYSGNEEKFNNADLTVNRCGNRCGGGFGVVRNY